MEPRLLCSSCEEFLPRSGFSKTKLNKLDKGAASSIRCVRCVDEEERMAMLNSKNPKKRKKAETNASSSVPTTITTTTSKQKKKRRSDDPSMLYIDSPLQAPLAVDALRFFTNDCGLGSFQRRVAHIPRTTKSVLG